MLSTIHLPLFKCIRHEIRVYAGFPGFKCETYSKITFMQKYGVTLYVPKEVSGMNEKRLFKTLFRKYRYLNVRFLILTRTTFTKDHPDKPPHKRSRIGDRILLLDGPALYEVLKTEPEDKKYPRSLCVVESVLRVLPPCLLRPLPRRLYQACRTKRCARLRTESSADNAAGPLIRCKVWPKSVLHSLSCSFGLSVLNYNNAESSMSNYHGINKYLTSKCITRGQ